MNITLERFIRINKWAIFAAIFVYLVGVFTPVKYLAPGLIFCFGAAFFLLLHPKYFLPRLKLAAHIWMVPVAITLLTAKLGLEPVDRDPDASNWLWYGYTLAICLIPMLLLFTGSSDARIPKKQRMKIVSARTVVQCCVFMIWASVTSYAFIKGSRPDLAFWAAFHVSTVAVLPFLFGRVICGWICPNATMQDALYKNMDYKRPIPKLPRAIEAQSNTCAMNTSGEVDKRAPLLPATLLLSWFPMFFAETVFDLTPVDWYPVSFMYGLILLSLLFKWRKMCTHFCWLSSYRAMAGHGSMWRIRYNRNTCRNCKRCLAEEACPFYINITAQDNEMPATCCLCFSCMEACPFDDVLTFRRAPEEKKRLKAMAKGLPVPETVPQEPAA